MRFLVFVASCLLLINNVHADTVYVDINAAGVDDGTSWVNAYDTIQEGVDGLSSGNVLKIKSGIYDGSVGSISSTGKYFTSETRIETDDGLGAPGIVIITGATTHPTLSGAPAFCWNFANVGDLTIDGRQSTMEGDVSDGFIFAPLTTAGAIGINEYSGRGRIRILRTEGYGAKPDSDHGFYLIAYASQIEFAYNYTHATTGSSNGDQVIIYSEFGFATTAGNVHHNNISGRCSSGYGLLTFKRVNGVDIYNNYIHSASQPDTNGIILRDFELIGSDGGSVYNNVIVANNDWVNCVQVRGFSTGTGGSDNIDIYNNTCAELGGSFNDAPFRVTDDSDGNRFFNNLLIGSFVAGVDYWSGGNQGTNNEIYNNVVTGTLSNGWFYNASVRGMFSTQTGGTSSQGTAFINLSGTVPSPYYDLSSSQNGTGNLPATDYNGHARSNPVDVGAFEFSSANTSPVAYIDTPSGDQTIAVNDSVSFSGTISDPDGDAVSATWDFDGAGSNYSCGQTAEPLTCNAGAIQFTEAGIYNVNLTGTDANGATHTEYVTITVESPPDSGITPIPSGSGSGCFIDSSLL